MKIRNRLYITLMQQAVKAIVADVKQRLHEKKPVWDIVKDVLYRLFMLQ